MVANFLSEGVRLGLDMKIARMGSTWCITQCRHFLLGAVAVCPILINEQ